MAHQFAPGDDLIFQLESGLGLLRILAIEGEGAETVWHLLAYDEFFPSVDAAEAALQQPNLLSVRKSTWRLRIVPLSEHRQPDWAIATFRKELAAYYEWTDSDTRKVSDRSALLQLVFASF